MVVKEEKLPKVSLSSTKKEMLDAYHEMKKKLEDTAAGELKPEEKGGGQEKTRDCQDSRFYFGSGRRSRH